jgi:N12 class adenine-specific DNA methylase
LGIDQGEIYSPGAGAGRRPLNAANFRFGADERRNVGQGSLKQKAHDNFAAIELAQQLDRQERPATEEEKRVLVRYVGWGGIPQVFASWQDSPDWQDERTEIQRLLTPTQYEAARASTLNAHYTSPTVVSAMYDAVGQLGFTGGRVLEPAVGLGHFFGLMPEEMHARSKLTGIELDPVTASIAAKLYPDADVRAQGFEHAALVDNSFDLAISNVPFGDYKPVDLQFNDRNFVIHDYFFAKGVEKVRPGGLLVFITSKGTLDKFNSSVRGYLAERTDFLGAIRLPNTAFKENANTEVTTDIVFLRKLLPGERPQGARWLDLAEHRNPDGVSFQVNEYFAANPHMMLGTMRHAGRMYRANEPTLAPDDRDLAEALRGAIAFLPERVVRPDTLAGKTVGESVGPVVQLLAPDHIKENAFTTLEDGRIAIRTGATLTPVARLSEESTRRIRGMIRIRDAVRDTLRTQLEGADDSAILLARRQLNERYDQFVVRFGPINELRNAKAFSGDPDLPLLLSLENFDEESRRATKTAIFTERTIHQNEAPRAAESAQDALVLTLNATGRVDLDHMEGLLRRPAAAFLPELKGLIYRNPQNEQWETEDQYLSGHVREKLAAAQAAAEGDPDYRENVVALEAVQPEDLSASEIDARLGAVWIPPKDIEDFANAIVPDGGAITVSHAPQVGTWFVESGFAARASVANTTDWGTARYRALELVQDALNLKTPTVYDKDPHTELPVINVPETEAARDKLEKIKERFKAWIWEDDSRRERLCAKYNTEFNSTRLRVFNGSHLTLPSSSQQIQLRPHQKDGIWRVVQSDNTVLAHCVGAGKTYTMVAAGIELKRLGLAQKPMFVVPNHMLEQFSTELLTLYPTANILVAGKEDFEASKRARLFSRIATGNWDGVIVTHASFEKIPMSFDSRHRFIDQQIREVEVAIRQQRAEGRGTRLVKELERIKKKLSAKLETLSASHRKDSTLTFEELGIDRLFVDEAHKFKNLFYVTKMNRVAGLPQTASERAFDLFLKVQYIQERNQGGGVVFATGTPISNTMAEMFTMQRYLQMRTLRRTQMQHFDSWAATFGEAVTSMELSPDGRGYRLQTRFARFVNVPELMGQFRQVADVRTAEMLKLPVPKLEEGKPVTISAPASPELKRFVERLVERTEDIKNGRVEPREDNMLKITSEGRKAALDLRLMLPHLADNPDSKINQAVANVHRIWERTAPVKGTQMVFCDLSTPSAGNRGGFNVYDDVRSKLIARGVPSEEIAFIQDYDDDASKNTLFKTVREGKVRVLLGSTPKMGEGTNVQRKLAALHHLDAPWRPADIEQREGRIVRQGNRNEFVSIFRYVTEGSFDAYMWQTLENKCRFIAQVMNGDATVRRAEDVDAAALTYAEVKAIASGNPLVIEKAGVDAEVARLTRLKKQHLDSQYQVRYRIKSLGESIEHCERTIANLRTDLAARVSTQGDRFVLKLKKETYTDRVRAGRALVFLAESLRPFTTTHPIGEVGGFPFAIQRMDGSAKILIQGKADHEANISDNALGTVASVEKALQSMESRLEARAEDLADYQRKREELGRHVGLPFEYEDKLVTAAARQQEIVTALDLTKNQAGTQREAGSTEESTTIPTAPAIAQQATQAQKAATGQHQAMAA